MNLALLEQLMAARAAKRPVVLATNLPDGAQVLLSRGERAPADEALRLDTASVVDGVLYEPHNPPLRLFVVGAVHVAEPLSQIAAIGGFAVTLIDPRKSWATPERFPGRELVLAWPDTAIESLKPDTRTAIVTLTHDPKLDDPGLVAALASEAFYIGCLGSKKTHASRLERLAAAGCDRLERLHGPVGLPIHARSPAEIAVSIFAEIVATLRGGRP
ncbi:MAG: XdhC family protein [Kofleriaceae bacterium]